ncbi:MAG: hypothetical protein HC842_01490 [Cytophagales bacterium]|nr:hypothetical protein [Cytophagales bacterium]
MIETPRKSAEFDTRLEELNALGNKLINSFRPSFVSSMHMTTTFNFNNYGFYGESRSSFLKLFAESGGTFQELYGSSWLDERGLAYYRYLKASADYRRYLPLRSPNTVFAYRAHLGVAYAYGPNEVLPYDEILLLGRQQ